VVEPIRSKPLAEILLDIKRELISFVETRVTLFQSEFQETAESMKGWVPLAATAGVLLSTAYLLMTAAIVGLVSLLFVSNQFRWPIALSSVGAVEILGGVVAVAKARNAFRKRGTFPAKTIEILKTDSIWLKDEVKRAS
jgi:uncharacterized membrane protein YqjE